MNNLHEIIRKIWMNEIQDDYIDDYILNEDTLKNSMYHHIRTEIEKHRAYKNLRIYTECTAFGFSNNNQRPDIIIAERIKDNNDSEKIWIEKIVAVFELKYKGEQCYNLSGLIQQDFHKMYDYKNNTSIPIADDCRFYVAAITPGDYEPGAWVTDRRTTENWAKGSVTELLAYGTGEKPNFEIIEH